MRDDEIDDILEQAAQVPHEVDPALLERVARSIGTSLGPVRPLPPAWILAGGLVLICVAVAVGGAARAGFYGIQKLGVLDRAVIFPTLGGLLVLGALAFAGEMIPASRRRVSPGWLLAAGSMALLGIFAMLFHDYRTDHFVKQGIVCLSAGVLHAIPAGIAGWWLVRRGLAVNPMAAGLVAGTLAGLAGVTMLELHCANFEAPHVALWHTAVIPICGAAGAIVAWVARLRLRRTDQTKRN